MYDLAFSLSKISSPTYIRYIVKWIVPATAFLDAGMDFLRIRLVDCEISNYRLPDQSNMGAGWLRAYLGNKIWGINVKKPVKKNLLESQIGNAQATVTHQPSAGHTRRRGFPSARKSIYRQLQNQNPRITSVRMLVSIA
jgi:hypothetical protein